MRALLVGCGNIGAMYDYYTSEITTHAKVYELNNIKVDFIEPKEDIADKVVTKYGYIRTDYDQITLSDYDLLSICTPTQYHYQLLMDAIEHGVSVVICEKPIAYNLEQLEKLSKAYSKGKTKIIVNYIRRFQDSYQWLKNEIEQFDEPLTEIQCNYYKGVMNYGSHALDTIQYLTGFILLIESVVELNRVNDYFESDPTLTFHGSQQDVNFYFRGLTLNYPMFEIDLIFKSYRVRIFNGGTEVEILLHNKSLLHKREMLKNYMLPIMEHAIVCHKNKNAPDNFELALNLNKGLLLIIE